MDTIQKHARKLLAPYKRSQKADQIVASAKKLVELISNNNEIIPKQKNKIFSEVIWFISEADGKYTTRYRSKAVIDLAKSNPESQKKIIHEHVYTRKFL